MKRAGSLIFLCMFLLSACAPKGLPEEVTMRGARIRPTWTQRIIQMTETAIASGWTPTPILGTSTSTKTLAPTKVPKWFATRIAEISATKTHRPTIEARWTAAAAIGTPTPAGTATPTRTPRPTPTPAPTWTPRPSPTPDLSRLREIVAEASNLEIRDFQAFDPGTGLLQANIDLDLGFTLTATGLTKAQIKTYEIMSAVYQSGLPVGEVNLWFWAEFQDAYGNVRDDVAHKATLTKATADRINWDNPWFFSEQLWDVLDYKWSWK